MRATVRKHFLAPKGSTGNATGSAVRIGADWTALALQFVAEAVGATPTVTYKFQGSVDGTNWYDVAYITDSADTVSVATDTATAVGSELKFLASPGARRYKFIRVVTSSNTNVTYRAEVFLID